MRTGQNGRKAILWTQTEIDGLEAAPLESLTVGAAWSWRGVARRLDVAAEMMLGKAESVGSRVVAESVYSSSEIPGDVFGTVVLTNGARQYRGELIVPEGEDAPTLVFEQDFPERDQDYWVSDIREIGLPLDAIDHNNNTVIAFPARNGLL